MSNLTQYLKMACPCSVKTASAPEKKSVVWSASADCSTFFPHGNWDSGDTDTHRKQNSAIMLVDFLAAGKAQLKPPCAGASHADIFPNSENKYKVLECNKEAGKILVILAGLSVDLRKVCSNKNCAAEDKFTNSPLTAVWKYRVA